MFCTWIKIAPVFKPNPSHVIRKRARNFHKSITINQLTNNVNFLNKYVQNQKNRQSFIYNSRQNCSRFSAVNEIKSNYPESKVVDEQLVSDFMNTLPEIHQELKKHYILDVPKIGKHLDKVLEYNVLHGEYLRGAWLIAAYRKLEKPEKLTPENIRLVNILAWCLQIQEACGFMLDDLVDHSEFRRGQPCWHRKEKVGLNALNDALFVENASYLVLKQFLAHHPQYSQMVFTFHDMALKGIMGQILDTKISNNASIDMFTMSTMKTMVQYKTGYGLFHHPLILAMYLANYKNPEQYEDAKAVLLDIALLFQMKNDYLDCFGNTEVTGRIGNDIQRSKCSWLIVSALEIANPVQKQIIKEHYGKDNVQSVNIIRELYEELNLREIYKDYEESFVNGIRHRIEQIKDLPQDLFLKLFLKTFAK